MADAVTISTILNATGLELGDHLSDVHGHGAELGVRHEATGTEDLTDATNLGHHHRGGDGSIEVDLALLDLGDELVGTDDVGAGLSGLLGLSALGEDGDTDGLAGAVGQGDGATDVLIGLTGVDAEAEVSLNGLVELGVSKLLHELDGLERRVNGSAVNLSGGLTELLAMLGSHVITSCGASGKTLPHRSRALVARELLKCDEMRVTRRW